VRHATGAQCGRHRRQRLGVDGFRVGRLDSEDGQLVRADTRSDTEVDPAAGELVQRRDLLGEPERVVAGRTLTSAPMRIVRVRWVSAARNRFGDGQTDSGVPWCSVTW